jgi:hypothetical protein
MNLRQVCKTLCASTVVFAASAGVAIAAPVVFSDSGALGADILAEVNAFRSALGNNNGVAAIPFSSGRREINWDGGGAVNGTAPQNPFTVFQNARGATFTTPGTGLTQAQPGAGLNSLADQAANATYGTTFATFSPLRLFAPIGSNITDGTFSVPGSGGAIPAVITGFGAVFTDVDLADSTSIEFFSTTGNSLGSFDVPAGPAATPNGSLSFLGVFFDSGELISRIRITTGTDALGPNDNPAAGVDVVVMDDFIYGEPRRLPEPTTLVLLGIGFLGIAGFAMRRRKDRKD